MELASVTFCLVCCFNRNEVCEITLHLIVLTTNSTYGSGGLATHPHVHATTAVSSRRQWSAIYMCLVYKFTAVQQQKQAASR